MEVDINGYCIKEKRLIFDRFRHFGVEKAECFADDSGVYWVARAYQDRTLTIEETNKLIHLFDDLNLIEYSFNHELGCFEYLIKRRKLK